MANLHLDPAIEKALETEALALGAIDTIVIELHSDLTRKLVLDASGKPDTAAVKETVRKIKNLSPNLFRETDFALMNSDVVKDKDGMTQPSELDENEKAFRKGLSTPPRFQRDIPKLDWARLSDEEFRRADAVFSGRSNDIAYLKQLAARQNPKDAA